jgi:DNA-binding GntR family transcriptional regulator
MNEQIGPVTTSEFAYRQLKEWILVGECKPGEKINQDLYAKRMGISRLPVRTALERLANDNLVVLSPRKGCIVTPISKENLSQIFTLRCVLEPLALREASSKAKPSDFMRIKEFLDETSSVEPTLETSLKLNKDFHFMLYTLSGNDVLIKIIENLWEQSQRYRIVYFTTLRKVPRISTEHYQIIDLLLENKIDEADDLLVKHTQRSLNELIQVLAN